MGRNLCLDRISKQSLLWGRRGRDDMGPEWLGSASESILGLGILAEFPRLP